MKHTQSENETLTPTQPNIGAKHRELPADNQKPVVINTF